VTGVKTANYVRKGRLKEALDLEWYLKTRKREKKGR
jgi:hypothetical protein